MKKIAIVSLIVMFIMSAIGYYNVEATDSLTEVESRTVDEENIEKTATEETVELTDFSSAKYELKKDGISKAIIEITGVIPKDPNIDFYLYITSNSDKPNISTLDSEKIRLSYDENNKTFKTADADKVAKYVELNQDIYVSIAQDTNVLTSGTNLGG